MDEALIRLVSLWDDVDNAAARVETSLPFQMSEAIARLEETRKVFRIALQSYAMSRNKP
ncbi:hypothetical protein KEU06_09185 [Pseudaminobacter sp. 19-2017]|uniref:Uncharacterized protein n=1 Tax=Pseudaminobacter soli (ex Zhang et al. 2022) TaxID=2831468 RepID=A0A942E5D3_9HYPH|nr:hypothetical protein [Pseudaminobacter soli]MBS3648777.1 hypothetical protein [Pseudaminobacter soli]